MRRTLAFALAACVFVGLSIPMLLNMRLSTPDPDGPDGPLPTPALSAIEANYEADYEFVFAMLNELDEGFSSTLTDADTSFGMTESDMIDMDDSTSLLDLWNAPESDDEETMG